LVGLKHLEDSIRKVSEKLTEEQRKEVLNFLYWRQKQKDEHEEEAWPGIYEPQKERAAFASFLRQVILDKHQDMIIPK